MIAQRSTRGCVLVDAPHMSPYGKLGSHAGHGGDGSHCDVSGYSRYHCRSVAAKSVPVASTGSPRDTASAYTAQSPKLSCARCPIPFPKRPNAVMASLAWISSNGTTSLTSSSTSWYKKLTALSPRRARKTMPASRSDIEERTRSTSVSSASSSRSRDGSPSAIAISADVSIIINPESRKHRIRESPPGYERRRLEERRSWRREHPLSFD